MPEWVEWFFNGLGTEIISLIIGAIGGGLIGFRVGKRNSKFEQLQEAGSGSEQHQQGTTRSKSNAGTKPKDSKSTFCLVQKAGDNSKQTQIGRQDDV
jgi:hypothetical protein